MDKKFSSIVDELANALPAKKKDQALFIESRAIQLVSSAVNLIQLIDENFEPEMADELRRRLFNSIRTGDQGKFCRKIQQIRRNTP